MQQIIQKLHKAGVAGSAGRNKQINKHETLTFNTLCLVQVRSSKT